MLSAQINKNSIIHLSGKIASLFLGLFTVALMTRYLGQEGFGYYTTVVTFLQLFGVLADFGLSMTTIQMIARPQDSLNKTMSNIMTFRILSSFLLIGLAPVVILFFPYPFIIKMGVLITALSFFCTTLTQVMTGVFQQKLKMLEVTIAEVVSRGLLLILTAIFIWLSFSIQWIFGAITISSVFSVILVFWFARKYLTLRPAFDFDVWKEILKRTWPIALSISFNLIYLRMDILILSLTRTQAEVGLYGATYRVLDILTMLPAVYMGIVLPHLTRFFNENNIKKFKELLQSSFDSLMMFAVPIFVGTFLIASKIMVYIAGPEFFISGDILKVLIFASLAIFGTNLFGYGIVAISQQKKIIYAYLTTAIITLIGYLVFIPRFGFWGAAGCTVFAEFLVMIWNGVVLYRFVKFLPNLKFVSKAVVSSLGMLLSLYLLDELQIVLAVFFSALIYFSILYLLGGIKKESITEMFKLK